MNDLLLDIRGLKKYFIIRSGFLSGRRSVVKAIDGVDLQIFKGETLGLVGESGCGKTTLGRIVSRLEEPTSGAILFNDENVLLYGGEQLKNFRRNVQLIFQDPYSSLNPRMSAGAIVGESLGIHNILKGKEREERVAKLMEVVGLNREQLGRYPHEFSGGQRQRIGIARALALNPSLVIADEPVSALDVSIQAQILNLLKDLQAEFDLTYLFISHDLGVVGHMSDRIAVMYLGKIVEMTDRKSLYKTPYHPYTKALLAAVPVPNPSVKREKTVLKGDIPSPINPPSGCAFHPRCPFRMDICDTIEPELLDKGGGHLAACHLSN
ncbi:MAG: dipeptide ABC transporter ATP-binding protein [Deltaproteobacteria bacterium]|nr:dipeptide ABC transporter ATP-binding protein [Deltaproteobacteria bacterium]MBN2844909.1 dipeptide ABC transporter ATP-binding protein [Deltaproteobacteria bacterium]